MFFVTLVLLLLLLLPNHVTHAPVSSIPPMTRFGAAAKSRITITATIHPPLH
jgi:hypothetical protein